MKPMRSISLLHSLTVSLIDYVMSTFVSNLMAIVCNIGTGYRIHYRTIGLTTISNEPIRLGSFFLVVLVSITAYTPCFAGGSVDLTAISQIESAGCKAQCYGDGGKSLGKFQLSASVFQEYRKFHPDSDYSHKNALDSTIATRVASWYLQERIPSMLSHFGKPLTIKNILIAYNCGIKCVVDGRIPPVTKSYISKYQRITKQGA